MEHRTPRVMNARRRLVFDDEDTPTSNIQFDPERIMKETATAFASKWGFDVIEDKPIEHPVYDWVSIERAAMPQPLRKNVCKIQACQPSALMKLR